MKCLEDLPMGSDARAISFISCSSELFYAHTEHMFLMMVQIPVLQSAFLSKSNRSGASLNRRHSPLCILWPIRNIFAVACVGLGCDAFAKG